MGRIDDDEQPKPTDESLTSEPPKKSAFGFIQKKPIKPQQSDPSPSNQLSFVTNGTSVPQIPQYNDTENESNPGEIQSAVNFSDRRPSESSNASEPVSTGGPFGKTSAFSFIKKVKSKFTVFPSNIFIFQEISCSCRH